MFVPVYKMLRFDAIDVHMRKRYTKSEFNKNEKQNVLHTTPFVVLHKQTCRIYDIRGDRWNFVFVFGFVALFVICVYASSSCVSHRALHATICLRLYFGWFCVTAQKWKLVLLRIWPYRIQSTQNFAYNFNVPLIFFSLVSSLLYVYIARNNRIVGFFFEMEKKETTRQCPNTAFAILLMKLLDRWFGTCRSLNV